jgi:hypothetical protein
LRLDRFGISNNDVDDNGGAVQAPQTTTSCSNIKGTIMTKKQNKGKGRCFFIVCKIFGLFHGPLEKDGVDAITSAEVARRKDNDGLHVIRVLAFLDPKRPLYRQGQEKHPPPSSLYRHVITTAFIVIDCHGRISWFRKSHLFGFL